MTHLRSSTFDPSGLVAVQLNQSHLLAYSEYSNKNHNPKRTKKTRAKKKDGLSSKSKKGGGGFDSMSAHLCLPEKRVNRQTLCLCSSSCPTLSAASLLSLQLPCQQFVFLPTQGSPPPHTHIHTFSHFAKSTLLKQIQYKLAIYLVQRARCVFFNIRVLLTC